MKTLFLVKDFPPDTGGVQAVLGRMARLWPGEVRVIAVSTEGDADHDRAYPWPVRRIPSFRGLPGPVAVPLRQIAFLVSVAVLWHRFRFDRIVCGYVAANGPVAFLWRLLFRTPYVVMTYGMELLSLEDSTFRSFWKIILERAEAVATIARFFNDFLSRFAPRARAVTIPLGCDAGGRAAAVLPEPYRGHTLAGRRIVLTVGRLVARKGIDTALAALSELARERNDLLYVVAGDGEDRGRLERIAARLGLADRVIFTGRVTPGELAGLYEKADIFVMPSRQIGHDVEGFGIVFLEAGARGVPVIGGCSGGVPDAVQDGVNGFLADPLDPKDVARKMAEVLDDPALAKKMGQAGMRIARETHTFENMTAALIRALGIQEESSP